MTEPLVTRMSEKYSKSPAAVLLSWGVQRGNWSVVPKSANPERMKANLDVSKQHQLNTFRLYTSLIQTPLVLRT